MQSFNLSLPSLFGGIQIRLVDHMVVPHPDGLEDWSKVRSPGRARRRRAKHRQNIVPVMIPDPSIVKVGNAMYGHPATIRQLIASMESFREDPPPPPKPRPPVIDPSRPLNVETLLETIKAFADKGPIRQDPFLTGTGLSMLYSGSPFYDPKWRD